MKFFKITAAVTAAMFAVFAVRLADWQLVHGEEYRREAAQSTGTAVTTEAVRGEILDRSGKGLVVNRTRRRIVIDKLSLTPGRLDSLILALIALTERGGDKWNDNFPVDEDGGTYIFRKGDNPFDKTAAEVVKELQEQYDIADGYSPRDLRNLIAVHWQMEQSGFSDGTPYRFADDVSVETMTAVSENTQGVGGAEVQTYPVREAVNPTLAPHLLGAMGAVSEDEYAALSEKGYRLTDRVGKFGIERALESDLRGEGGKKLIVRDADGATLRTIEKTDARPGNTVWLTIDSALQEVTVKALAGHVKAARDSGKAAGEKYSGEDCTAGAAVLLDVRDFSVLAAASCPTYDLNRYSDYGDYYVSLATDETSPLFDRACDGSFACGSVFKPLVAAAALQEQVIAPDDEIICTRYYDYYPSNVVACMHRHGAENLYSAMAHSCNYYFAEVGRRLGIDAMARYAARAGLGAETGLEIGESGGFLAGRDSEDWAPGNTVQAAIGQSDNAFTPMQLATCAATLANGGKRLRTHLVQKITDYAQERTLYEAAAEEAGDLGVSAENLAIVRQAMRGVAEDSDGTAYSVFGGFSVPVAAKTGTAENSGSDHAVFICYAPCDNPEVAAAVVLEHGAVSRFAAETAKEMLEAYFEQKATS